MTQVLTHQHGGGVDLDLEARGFEQEWPVGVWMDDGNRG